MTEGDSATKDSAMNCNSRKVCVRVPATTANLGPGYDTLGMAMAIFMELTAEIAETFSLTVEGEGANKVSHTQDNMIVKTCEIAFNKYGKRSMPPLKFHVVNNIPYGCGCGSSSAAALAGFLVGMHFCGFTMATHRDEELLSVITRIEGHPDNAAPAIYGGIQLSFMDASNHVHSHRVPVPPHLSLVLFVPDKLTKASTAVTRELIPSHVSLADAIHNISRASMLMLALTTGKLSILQDCSDRLHERQRAGKLYPHYFPCVEASRKAGAEYTFLSGAGPTVCSFVSGRHGSLLAQPLDERRAGAVAEAMVAAAAAAGVSGRAIITQPSDLGAHLRGVEILTPDVQYIGF